MAAPQRNEENFLEMEGDTTEMSLAKVGNLSVDDPTDTGMLRSRINQQSDLICMLKHRADELLLRCEALKKINAELESSTKDYQTELESERKKANLIGKRFNDLANNNQAIIAFMDEYKSQNGLLKQENKQLQAENDTLFSQKLQDKEICVQNLQQEIKELMAKCTNKENEHREKLADYQSKLQEQARQHQAKEDLLLDQLHDTKQQQRDTEEMCRDLKLKLEKAEEEHAQRELKLRESITSLNREKDKLLQLSMDRGKLIQEKQEEIQQLEIRLKEEKKARAKAENRFHKEAEAVNADLKVKSLQSTLDEATTKYSQFKKEFEAYKEHSTNLLTQERELNKKLRHMVG
ncbi:coiled-coil domain-containing protein 89 [Halichoeres trimaculatus]|uniref:coiled-coil domain-containing protein 89 n=1 Tax=Halichoeres trimaculatus TaxID=147232 RepID=UPI003D9E5510